MATKVTEEDQKHVKAAIFHLRAARNLYGKTCADVLYESFEELRKLQERIEKLALENGVEIG